MWDGRGAAFGFLLFVSSLLGSIFLLVPFVPLVYLSPRGWRFFADRLVGYWLTFPASLCNYVFGVEFHVSGDLIERNEPALIIMNHRTRLDWLFFWNALYKMDPWLLTTEKIVLKAPLKCIPGAGWAMGCGAYMFLERNLDNDQKVMQRMVNYYADTNPSYQVLLFPEGTDRGKRAVYLSDAFAERNQLPKYEYVLHPRTAGFTHLLHRMRQRKYVRSIYDVTVAYPKQVVSSEMELLQTGRFPREVHFDIKKYSADEVPLEEVQAASWLNDLWEKKEKQLKNFYETDGAFEPREGTFLWPLQDDGIGYQCAVVFWALSSCIWIYSICVYTAVRLYVLLSCVFFMYCHQKYGGVEYFAEHVMRRRQHNNTIE